jgi:hypothetical protein
MSVGAGNVSVGFGIARALATAAFTIWCFLLLRNYIVPAAAIVLCLLVALTAGAPFALTSSPFSQSMAMFYNRFGYVLLGLVILEGFRPAQSSFMGGVSSGIAIGSLLFLKINFFGASLGFLAVSLVVSRPRWERLTGLVAGFLLLTIAFLIWLGFDIAAIARDLRSVAVVRSSALPMRRLLRTLDDSLLAMLLLFGLGVIVTALNWRKRQGSLHKLHPIALALSAMIAELAVGIANQQNAVFIVMSVCCMLLLASLPDAAGEGTTQSRTLLGAVLILGLCLPLPGCIYDFVALGNALQHDFRQRSDQGLPHLDAPGLSSLVFEGEYPDPYKYENGSALVEVVNDGIHLLREHTPASYRVLTLGYVNPFPVCLGRPAPRGSSVFFDVGFNVADGLYPPATELFAEADAVMVPKYNTEAKPTTDALVAEYNPTLKDDYVLKGESPFWILYTRRASTQ